MTVNLFYIGAFKWSVCDRTDLLDYLPFSGYMYTVDFFFLGFIFGLWY